jgi:SagB-type dehydrogenase family enzyme
VLSFAKGATVKESSGDRTIIDAPLASRQISLTALSPGIKRAIDILSAKGATEDELLDMVEQVDGVNLLARFYYYLLAFTEHQLLTYGLQSGNKRLLARLEPASKAFRFLPTPVDRGSMYILSRFAYLHPEEECMILESPLAHGKIALYGWDAVAVVTELAKPRRLDSLADAVPSTVRYLTEPLVEMFLGANFVSKLDSDHCQAHECEALAQWEFHDLLFHARSRKGRHANAYGGTLRFRNTINPLPAVKQCCSAEIIELYRPDMTSSRLGDSGFTQVLEERRSVREYGAHPISDRQLGEFLYRSARVKQLKQIESQELSIRPYPGGGAIYELEVYVNVHSCDGIPRGLYHYCPSSHHLERISGPTEAVEALLTDAARSAGCVATPQVLLTVAARFQRVSWKYESMAYSLVLKNVGVLYQTMYLVATAMHLAPCALGGGDSDLFARATGLDYYAETSVGEFLLGSR